MPKKMGVTHAALQIKAAGPADGLKEGQFRAYASVFGNVDSYGDIVEKGAFLDTLAEWDTKGVPIPLLWGHDMHDPFSNIGGVFKATEDDTGLLVEAELDLDNPTAAQVYRLVKGRRVTDLSFAYTVENERKDAAGNHLLKLGLIEVSVVPLGANRETGFVAIKSLFHETALKAGRVLSAANESALKDASAKITEALAGIDNVLAAVANTPTTDVAAAPKGDGPTAPAEASGTPEGKASPAEDPDAERPDKAAPLTEDPKAEPSVETIAATFDYYALT